MKKHNKIAKLITVFLIMIVVASTFIACGGSGGSDSSSSSKDPEFYVTRDAQRYYSTKYDIKRVSIDVTKTEDKGDGKYYVYGKASIVDNYEDNWTSKFEGTVDTTTEYGDTDLTYDEPVKQ